jgi:putative ABC transport system permease protein
MSQAVRDRIPELAILKTLGFSDRAVMLLVIGESLLLCVVGGLLGMLFATGLMKLFAKLPIQLPPLTANAHVWTIAISSMLLLGIVVGLPPALRAMRLRIVDALAGR